MLHHHLRYAIALAACFLGAPAIGQIDDGQLWLQANTVAPLAKDYTITFEQIARFGNRQNGLYTTEYGAIIDRKITKNVQLGFGFRRVDFFNGNIAASENRFRQHIVGKFGRFNMRLRLDERFSDAGSGIGFRIRPLLRYNMPINDKGLNLFVSHESFILPNSTKWGQRSGYERMRNLVGAAFPIGPHINADLGYLNQYRLARGAAPAIMEHALALQLTYKFDRKISASAHD